MLLIFFHIVFCLDLDNSKSQAAHVCAQETTVFYFSIILNIMKLSLIAYDPRLILHVFLTN